MEGARVPALRHLAAGAAARRRDNSLEDRLAHPIFDALRPWLAELGAQPSLASLNAAAERQGLRTAGGQPALCWLAFPRTKARINALHAAEMPREGGRRGRLRDLLTIFDEGGALVACADEELNALVREFRWKALFWEQRARVRASMRFVVLGHAVLEQALAPWPGITCKVLFVDPARDPDAQAADWLARLPADASPRLLAPLPVFGYPGWLPESDSAAFYDDTRFFRPLRAYADGAR
jgi:hypothetical protein